MAFKYIIALYFLLLKYNFIFLSNILCQIETIFHFVNDGYKFYYFYSADALFYFSGSSVAHLYLTIRGNCLFPSSQDVEKR